MPQVGQAAPDFQLLNQDGQTVRLSDFRGVRVIIFAFPKANTMGCNNQACAFRDNFPQIESHMPSSLASAQIAWTSSPAGNSAINCSTTCSPIPITRCLMPGTPGALICSSSNCRFPPPALTGSLTRTASWSSSRLACGLMKAWTKRWRPSHAWQTPPDTLAHNNANRMPLSSLTATQVS